MDEKKGERGMEKRRLKIFSVAAVLFLLCLTFGCAPQAAQLEKSDVDIPEDQQLIDRTLYLLDPYILPVSWWTGAGYDFLYPADSFSGTMLQPEPDASAYFEVLRFCNMEEMKRVTEQIVTKAYAQDVLYPRGEAYFLEQDGKLYVSAAACTGSWKFRPLSAQVLSKTECFAEMQVVLGTENGSQFTSTVYLQDEDQTWKLANTPFTPKAAGVERQQSDPGALPTDEQLEQRLFALMDWNTYPIPWFCGAGDEAIGTLEMGYEPLPDTGENTTFYEVSRFANWKEFDRAVEQVFTHEFAEKNLYPLREKNQDYMMRDGKLYRNTSMLGSGWRYALQSAVVVSKTERTAELSCEFLFIDSVSEGTVVLEKEEGLWKIASLPEFMVPEWS